MGKVMTNIPNPLPHHNLFPLESLEPLEPSCDQKHSLISFQILSPQITELILPEDETSQLNLYLRFIIDDWFYETEVKSLVPSIPLVWDELIISGRCQGNKEIDEQIGDLGVDIEMMTLQKCTSNELLFGDLISFRIEVFQAHPSGLRTDELFATTEYDLYHSSRRTGTIQQLELSLQRDSSPIGVIKFQLILEPNVENLNTDLKTSQGQMNQHNLERRLQRLQFVSDDKAVVRKELSTTLLQQNEELQVHQLKTQRTRVRKEVPPPIVVKKPRPRSAVLPTHVVHLESEISTHPHPILRPSSAKISRSSRSRRVNHHPVPIAFIPIVAKPKPNELQVEIRGNNFKSHHHQRPCPLIEIHGQEESRHIHRHSYNRTITTDRTSSSEIVHDPILSESEIDLQQRTKSTTETIEHGQSLNILSIEIPQETTSPIVPHLPSPFSLQINSPGRSRHGTRPPSPHHGQLSHDSFLYLYLNNLNISPDQYLRQVDRSLQWVIWEEFYFILIPREEIISLCQHHHLDMDLLFNTFSLHQASLPNTSRQPNTEPIMISLISPISFVTTFLSLSVEEYYATVSHPTCDELLNQSISLLQLLLISLIGPWEHIRQLILQHTTHTNTAPKFWSSSFLQKLFHQLELSSFSLEKITTPSAAAMMTVEEYLLSSNSSPSFSFFQFQTFKNLKWKLYRHVLLLLCEWWYQDIYPTDIIWSSENCFHHLAPPPPTHASHRHSPFEQFPQRKIIDIPYTSSSISSSLPLVHFKEKDLVQISFTSKLFRLYLSLSRVYSWSYASPETLLRLSDLISNEIGVITTNPPLPPTSVPHKRTLCYSDMCWLSLRESTSKHSMKYLEATLMSLQDLEPVCGKYILLPSNCLKLIETSTRSDHLVKSRGIGGKGRGVMSLTDLSKDKIVTGMVVTVVSIDLLTRIYERVPWWDRPSLLTLQSLAGKVGYILSTISLAETNRVGIAVRDEGGIQKEMIESIPIDGLLIQSSPSSVPPSPRLFGEEELGERCQIDGGEEKGGQERENDQGQVKMKEKIISSSSSKGEEILRGNNQTPQSGSPQTVEEFQRGISSSYDSGDALQSLCPLKVSISDHQRSRSILSTIESISLTPQSLTLLSMSKNDPPSHFISHDDPLANLSSRPPPMIRPLYRPTTAGELNHRDHLPHAYHFYVELPSSPSPLHHHHHPPPSSPIHLENHLDSNHDQLNELQSTTHLHSIIESNLPSPRHHHDEELSPTICSHHQSSSYLSHERLSTVADRKLSQLTVQINRRKAKELRTGKDFKRFGSSNVMINGSPHSHRWDRILTSGQSLGISGSNKLFRSTSGTSTSTKGQRPMSANHALK
jgi:hypothetical protein